MQPVRPWAETVTTRDGGMGGWVGWLAGERVRICSAPRWSEMPVCGLVKMCVCVCVCVCDGVRTEDGHAGVNVGGREGEYVKVSEPVGACSGPLVVDCVRTRIH